jgi:hypothetical protein
MQDTARQIHGTVGHRKDRDRSVSDEADARLATEEGPAGLAARGCGCLAWAAALVLAFVVVSVVIIRHDLQPHAPDLRKFANSAGLRGLDSAATAWTGREARQIEAGAPWLSPHGDAVSDRCTLGVDGGGYLAVGGYSAQCDRTLFAFYSFDGSLPARLRELERALNGAGWSRFGSISPPFPPPPSPAGGAAPPLASEVPPVRAEVRPAKADAPKSDIEVNWIGPGQLNDPIITMGVLPASAENTDSVRYLQFRNINVSSLARQIFRAHQYMLIIQLIAGYYQNPNVQASTLPSG